MGNPNHDEHGRFSGSDLRGQIKSAIDYSQAKAVKDKLWEQMEAHSKALRAISGGGLMGMTPENVRATPEWQLANSNYAKSSAMVRAYNTEFLKKYSKEYKADRAGKYK
jgi:hypothetical protein